MRLVFLVGTAITHFQQVEAKGAIFWEPLVFAIGLAEAYRVSVGWAPPTSEGFNKLKEEYEPGLPSRDANLVFAIAFDYHLKGLQQTCVIQVFLNYFIRLPNSQHPVLSEPIMNLHQH